MEQKEMNKMIELLKANPRWIQKDFTLCNTPISCDGCPVIDWKIGKRLHHKDAYCCGQSFLIKFNKQKEEVKLEILLAVM